MSEVDLWASLRPELLNEIAKFVYFYDDYVRLRYCCKSWSLNLPKIPILPKVPNYARNPWLVLPLAVDSVETQRLEEQGIHVLQLPEMQKNVVVCGSCHGCLITVSVSDGALKILNPITKVSYDLPPISTFPNVVAYQPENIGDEYTLLMDDKTSYTLERTRMNRSEVDKIILSSPSDGDFMAVVICNKTCSLAFYRVGDSRWTEIPTEESGSVFADVIFHDEKIYAVNWIGQLYEFDMHTKPLPLGGPSEAKLPIFKYVRPYNWSLKYLVGCPNGDLLMVVRHFDYPPHNSYHTIKFDIHVLPKRKSVWSRLDTLGDYALMIGLNSSVLVPSTSSNPNRNRIYYTDNILDLHTTEIGGHDIGVLDLEDTQDNSNNQLFPNTERLYPPPIWLC